MKAKIYQFKANSLQGKAINLETYKGKIILVVNTASKYGLTPQYEGLEKLYEKNKDQGLVILGFPCKQFINQEPRDENHITENCLLNYGITFPMFAKVDVNEETSHPLFKYLRSELKGSFGNKL